MGHATICEKVEGPCELIKRDFFETSTNDEDR